jgi:hypothetical protein
MHATTAQHGTQGTVVRAKHTLDYGLAPDKIVHNGPARTTLWIYGMESRNIFSYVVQTRPGPLGVSYCDFLHSQWFGLYLSGDG